MAAANGRPRRTVLITDYSDGDLGSALAVEFHKDPSIRVFATARNPTKLARLTSMGIETLTLDVLDSVSIAACVAEVLKLTNDRLDVLVNNAGAGYSMPLIRASASSAARTGYQPMIVNHTSVVSVVPNACAGVYHASKAASAMLNDTLRLELKPFGMRVVEIKTGGVRSNFFSNLKTDADTAPKLPEGSIYELAREEIESVMRGEGKEGMSVESEVWARDVVRSLVKKNPKSLILAGWGAWIAFLLTVLPIPHTALDGQWMKMGKLDVLERRLMQTAVKKE